MSDGVTIGDQVRLIKGTTQVTGKVRGLRVNNDGDLDALWIEGLRHAFYFANGWYFVDVLTEDEIAEIERLNKLLEEGDHGDI